MGREREGELRNLVCHILYGRYIQTHPSNRYIAALQRESHPMSTETNQKIRIQY